MPEDRYPGTPEGPYAFPAAILTQPPPSNRDETDAASTRARPGSRRGSAGPSPAAGRGRGREAGGGRLGALVLAPVLEGTS